MSQFLSHTAVSSQGNSRWHAEVHRGWRIGSAANGGYVLALVGRASSERAAHRASARAFRERENT